MMVAARSLPGARKALPALLAFDPGVLQAMFGPESAVIRDVLETFFASMADHVLELEAATASGDLALVVAIAHRIKGAARMSGALALAMAAENLEAAGRAGPAGQLARAWADMQQQWQQLQRDPAFRHALQNSAAG
jgi:two-component system sensor histidine kinase EvgS